MPRNRYPDKIYQFRPHKITLPDAGIFLVIDQDMTGEDILRIKKEVADLEGIQNCEHVTIEFEYVEESCSMGM